MYFLKRAVSLLLIFTTCASIGYAESSSSGESGSKRNITADTSELKQRQVGAGWKTDLVEGERYFNNREYAKAESCYKQAYTELKHSRPCQSEEIAYCARLLADVFYAQDMLEDAMDFYKKSLHYERRSKSEDPHLLSLLITIGGVFEDEGDFKKARKYYERAEKLNDKLNGPNGGSAADLLHRLGRLDQKLMLPAKAAEKYMASLALLMQSQSLPDNKLLLEILSDYTDLLLKTDAPAKLLSSAIQSELLKDDISSLSKKSNPPVSHWTAEVTSRIGGSLPDSGVQNNADEKSPNRNAPPAADLSLSRKSADFLALEDINKQRIKFYERLIASDIDSLGAEHPSVARDLNGLASIYISQKKFAEAKPLLSRALEIYEKIYKEDAGPLKQTKLLLQLLSEESNPKSPNVDLSYIKSLPRIPEQAQEIGVALRLNDLAFMLFCQGRLDDSLRVYYWALASTANSTGESSLLAAANMVDMGKLLRMTGRSAEADKLENNARAIARKDLLEKRSKLLP